MVFLTGEYLKNLPLSSVPSTHSKDLSNRGAGWHLRDKKQELQQTER